MSASRRTCLLFALSATGGSATCIPRDRTLRLLQRRRCTPLTATRRARAQAYTYHGQQRDTRPAFLAEQDIVITTYSTLAQELKMRTGLLKARSSSPAALAEPARGRVAWLPRQREPVRTVLRASSRLCPRICIPLASRVCVCITAHGLFTAAMYILQCFSAVVTLMQVPWLRVCLDEVRPH